MHKNKMTLFAVILFGFTTAFSMQKAYNSIEDAIKDLKEQAQAIERRINCLPNNFPDRDRIFKEFHEYSLCINKKDVDAIECTKKIHVMSNMINRGAFELSILGAFFIQQKEHSSSGSTNNQTAMFNNCIAPEATQVQKLNDHSSSGSTKSFLSNSNEKYWIYRRLFR